MATSVHLQPELVAWLDREAARKGVTRSRLINLILSREMNARDDWSPDLFAKLVDSAMSEEGS
jgi:metal-responsive CopG/Arc/MetJ family transcriptional regulator